VRGIGRIERIEGIEKIEWSFGGHSIVSEFQSFRVSMVIRWSFGGHSIVSGFQWSFSGHSVVIQLFQGLRVSGFQRSFVVIRGLSIVRGFQSFSCHSVVVRCHSIFIRCHLVV
jgi:hypothetical protein